MPPKQAITREMVIEAAFELVRKKGITSLSARSVAGTLSCSTQPVYSCFKNMKVLEKAVVAHATQWTQDKFLARKTAEENNFKAIGLGYIALAKKEKHLFDLLYLSGRVPLDFENYIFPMDTDRLIKIMKKDAHLADLPREELLDLLCQMWIYTHGLTVLARTNPKMTEYFLDQSLDKVGHMMVERKLIERGLKSHENNCNQRQPERE